MVSRCHKRTAMYRNLQLLRSITNSHARHRKTSGILDASVYIQMLKQKLEELNEAVARAQNFIDYDPGPLLTVEAEEKGFMIKVWGKRNCQGLLVFILEAIEELGLDVLQARVSCVDSFCLEAVTTKLLGGATDTTFCGLSQKDNEEIHHMDAQLVQQAVSQAIQNWEKVTKQ